MNIFWSDTKSRGKLMANASLIAEPEVYQGQFGEFTITEDDRTSVKIYRSGLTVAAIAFTIASLLALTGQGESPVLTWLYAMFVLGLALSLATIHIYLAALHRALQVFLGVGAIASVIIALYFPESLALTVYHQPLTLLGVGFTFAALTGIFFKEGFCFNRIETKILTPLVPLLLLGHMTNLLPVDVERGLLLTWTIFFGVFVVRKLIQAIPPDIGDKSVFEHLKSQS
jgi:uncharacterized integral membrane protein